MPNELKLKRSYSLIVINQTDSNTKQQHNECKSYSVVFDNTIRKSSLTTIQECSIKLINSSLNDEFLSNWNHHHRNQININHSLLPFVDNSDEYF